MSTKNMTKDKEEKVAVVTGSSSGIGLETSLLLAKNGFLHLPRYGILTKPMQ